MAGLFNIPTRSVGRDKDAAIAKKASKRVRPSTAGISIKGGGGMLERISAINAMVAKNLGKYADRYIVLREAEDLHKYITKAIQNGVISIDTETNSLDPITGSLVGLCIYTPGEKAAYVPLHHISYVTGMEVADQISDKVATEEMQRLAGAKTRIIMFNAKFDIRFIKNQLGVTLIPYWDGYLAARLLNENEGNGNNGLKALHKKYVLHGEGDAFSFDSLFRGIPFSHIPIKTGYLYAARDAEITYELYEFQRQFLEESSSYCKAQNLTKVAKLFREIEMPVVSVVAEMEDNGIAFDFEFADQLSKKYNAILKEKEAKFYEILSRYQEEIDMYKAKNRLHKLSDPISISSPTQLAILFYDILQVPQVDKKSPRGTGEDILLRMDHPLSKAIVEYREVSKLLSTYIDKMGKVTNPKTGRIHCNFNQIGADTGRFSSSDPRRIISNWGRKIQLNQGRAIA